MRNKVIGSIIVVILLLAVALAVAIYAGLIPGLTPTQPGTTVTSTDTSVAGVEDDLTITNEISNLVDEGNGVYTITYRYVINHAGSYPVNNVFLRSWFNDTSLNTFTILNIDSSYGNAQINPFFDGRGDRNLITGSPSLPPFANFEVFLTIRLVYNDTTRQFINYVDIGGDYGGSTSTGSSTSRSSSSRTSTTSVPGSTPTPTSSRSATITVSSSASEDELYDIAQVTFPLPQQSSSSSSTSTSAGPIGNEPLPIGKGG